MRRLFSLAAVAMLASGSTLVCGQTPVPPVPTTVQLPTFHVFTVQTTVSVPDRGGMSLVGMARGADGSVIRGPLANRGLASSRGASGVDASATVIDNRELDRAVLAAAAGGGVAGAAVSKAAELSRNVGRAASNAPPGSLAAIRQ